MSAIEPPLASATDIGTLTVLLMSDEPARLSGYQAMLADLDLQCLCAQSMNETLEVLRARSVAVVMLDHHLPGMDGREAARAIRQHPHLKRLPILFVTSGHSDLIDGADFGDAVDYLSAPVAPSIFRSKVRWLAGLHRQQLELEAERQRLLELSEEQRRASHRRYRAIFEMPTQLTVLAEPIRDAKGVVVDWRCCDANAHLARLLGRSREDLLGSTLTEVLPDRAARLIPLWEQVLADGTLFSYEAQFAGLDFLIQLFPADHETLVCSGLNITARIAAEREAKRLSDADKAEKEWLAAVLRCMTDEVYFTDPRGLYGYANPAALRALGIDSLEGVSILELAEKLEIRHADGSARRLEDAPPLRALRGETVLREEQMMRTRPGGPWSYRQISCAPVLDKDDRILGAVSVVRDVTEQRRSQQSLRLREQQLREADQRKDEFIAMLAHELRNPLVPIRTGIELLRRTDKDPRLLQQIQPMMERQVGHMTRLIDDLLDISRISSGKIELKRQWVTLSTVVGAAVDAMRAAIQDNELTLEIDLATPEAAIEVDPTRITQVVSNLLHNAAKFTPAGGWIRLTAALEPAQPGKLPETIIRVADNGVGIKPNMLGHVFEMFAQAEQGADAREAGLGIGLAIARKIVELHGGTIRAGSAGVGQGSEFAVRLPVAMAATAVDSATSRSEMSLAGVRVLIVDDNRDAADVIGLLLKADQGEILTTYSAHEAFQALSEFQPQIVLMDIGMAGMNGLEACERIRKQYGQALSLIAISGWGQDHDKVRALEAGFDLHLTKPVDPAQLQASIRALLHREGSSTAR